jgi:DNA-binding LytR/AlgR family response regulator
MSKDEKRALVEAHCIESVRETVKFNNKKLADNGSRVRIRVITETIDGGEVLKVTTENGETMYIEHLKIKYIAVKDGYTTIFMNEGEVKEQKVMENLDNLEEQAEKDQILIRPNRSFIVNKYSVDYRDSYNLYMDGIRIGIRTSKIHDLCMKTFRTKANGGGFKENI